MIELLLNDPAHDTYTVPVPGQYQVPVYSSSTWYDGVYHTPLGRFRCWISPQLEQCRYRKGRRGNMSPRAFRRRIVRYILQYWLQTCAVPSMNRSVREQSSPLGHHSSCEVTLCASRACKRPPCGAISGLCFTATSIMHNLSTSLHATPIEFTHIGYHVVEDPCQKTVVDLGSRIPSLALNTTLLAPENPRTN